MYKLKEYIESISPKNNTHTHKEKLADNDDAHAIRR